MTNYVVCLKWGTKYSADYVNKLYNMVQRNLTLDHEFVCFTEDSRELDKSIRVEPLQHVEGITGWWYKTMFFNPNFPLQGEILFLDLDLVIFRNIDHLFDYSPGKLCIIQDFNRHMLKGYKKFNSSVFRFTTGSHPHIYTQFMKEPKANSKRYLGDQDWIYATVDGNYEYWPDNWIQSYKWEMRNRAKLDRSKPKGERDFEVAGDPTVLDDTCIAVFHGDPNPHVCKDPWVRKNWR